MLQCYAGQNNFFFIGPVFFALSLGSRTYFPTILELRELNKDVSDWKTNNGPDIVSLSVFGSNHQPGNANNNKDLNTLVRILPTNILATILFVGGGLAAGLERGLSKWWEGDL